MAHLYPLPRGPRVCLRMPRAAYAADAAGIRALCERSGAQLCELELARLVRFDPRHRIVICATAILDGREAMVGIGAIELAGGVEHPDTLVVDEGLTEGLDDLLHRALVGRAQALTRTRAA